MVNKQNILLALLLIFMSTCGEQKTSQKPVIVTGLTPIASLIRVIVGDEYEVLSIIPNNTDPHYFNLKPSDAMILAKANTIIALDDHFDGKILTTADNTKKMYLLNGDTDNYSDEHHGHDHSGHDHTSNPHLWLSYEHLGDLSQKITEILITEFPENETIFQNNNKEFNDSLQKSYTQIKKLYTDSDKQIFVVQRHRVWDYLLEELEINLIATVYEYEGEQVSVKKMVTIIDKINQIPNKDQIILIEDAFTEASTVLKAISKETGVQIKTFNPMGIPESTNENPIDLLNFYSEILVK